MSHFAHPGIGSVENPPLSRRQKAVEIKGMHNAIWGMVQHPPGSSTVVQAFALTAHEYLAKPKMHPDFVELIHSLNQSRQDLAVEHRAQLLRIAYQFVLHRAGVGYPKGGDKPERWDAWLRLAHERPYKGELEEALWSNYNQANIPNRYAGVKLALAAHADILPPVMTYVDNGTAAGLGPIHLAHGFNFPGIRVLDSSPIRKLVHGAWNRPTVFNKVVGYDLFVPSLPWIEACSYYPEEYPNKERQREREELYNDPGIFQFIHADVLGGTAGGLNEVRAQAPAGYDVGSSVTTNYEIEPDRQDEANIAFEGLIKTLAIYQEPAEIDPNNPRRLIYAKDLYAPSTRYNLFTKDLTRPDQPLEHLGTWNNYRCTSFRPTDLLIHKLIRQLA